LPNIYATVENIQEKLVSIEQQGPEDIAVLYFAGHGIRDANGEFRFLTSQWNEKESVSRGITWRLLSEHLDRLKGRVILFLDACHSGSIVNETIVPNNELAERLFQQNRGGVMVFSASKGRQYSIESADFGRGAGIFTYALSRGLGKDSKKADANHNGYVEFMELVDYVTRYVNKVTEGKQTPWLSRKELFGDMPIAQVVQ